ncbi:MAG: hypothetical protein ACR2LA_05890 [Acidimicrobiales bacterium]
MTGPDGPGGRPDPDEPEDPRLRAGFDHLQAAAHEMIAATRAFLDAAEQVVDDPRAPDAVAGLVGSLASLAGRWGPSSPPRPDDDDPPVQRIPVS